MAMRIDIELVKPSTATVLALPFAGNVQAGFPSPAEEYLEPTLDLNKQLVPRPASTFLARVKGQSMRDAGINEGDILVIDRSLKAEEGRTAVCFIDGEFTLKRLHITATGIELLPANPDFPAIPVKPESQFTVWGIVSYVIHKL